MIKMKWRGLIFLFTCLMMQKLVSGEDKKAITVQKTHGRFEFTCNDKWMDLDMVEEKQNPLRLSYRDDDSGDYKCIRNSDKLNQGILTIKFRTCDNCIELDTPALSAIIVGNLLATFLIGFAVYSITRQPKGRNHSGSKASDKMNLMTNGEGDTYQQLTGHTSEYSRLERKK